MSRAARAASPTRAINMKKTGEKRERDMKRVGWLEGVGDQDKLAFAYMYSVLAG